LNLIFPSSCFCCGGRTASKKFLCDSCESEITFVENDRYDLIFSLFDFNKPIKSLIHNLKYSSKTAVAKWLCQKGKEQLKEKIKPLKIDCIIPVPLYKTKKRTRGYNQSLYISQEVEKILGIETFPNILKRVKFTSTQTKLNRAKRQENIKEAFSLEKGETVKGKNVLLIDDVLTTGATIYEGIRVIKKAQPKNVYGLSMALAVEK